MGHVSNTIGAILIILATVGMAVGAGFLAFGTLDGEAAEQALIPDNDRENQAEDMVAGGSIALAMGFGLFIIGAVFAARPAMHEAEISVASVAARKTFGVILLVISLLLLIVGIGLAAYGFSAESEQGRGFNYDSNEGDANIAMATAGSAIIAIGVSLLISSIVMLAKQDQLTDDASPVVEALDDSQPAQEPESGTATDFGPQEDRNGAALYVVAAIAGFALLVAVIFMAMYGGGGNGGLFGDSKVYSENTFNYTMTNTGNAPVIGTIGDAWVQEVTGLERVSTISFFFETDATATITYTIERLENETWVQISQSEGVDQHQVVIEGDFSEASLRFRVEPSFDFVQSAEFGVLVIQES